MVIMLPFDGIRLYGQVTTVDYGVGSLETSFEGNVHV